MDRAETHLRLVGEAELRRGTDQGAGGPAGARFSRVVQALTAVDAIDAGTAGAIEADFELALTARHPGGAPAVSRRGPAARRISWPHARLLSSQPMASRSAPERLVPVGMTMPVQSGQSHGELHLLTYVQDAAGAGFTTMARLRSAPVPANPVLPPPDLPGSELLSQLTATDEAGTGYTLAFGAAARAQAAATAPSGAASSGCAPTRRRACAGWTWSPVRPGPPRASTSARNRRRR